MNQLPTEITADALQIFLALVKRRVDGFPNHLRPADVLLVIEVARSLGHP